MHLVSRGPVQGASVYADERALLGALAQRIREIDPDIITGWNVVDFDLRVWAARCAAQRVAAYLGRVEGELRFQEELRFARQNRVSIPGRMVLDGMALVYRAHFAFIRSPIFNSRGQNTSALFGFTNTLLNILANEEPTHIAVALDQLGRSTEAIEHFNRALALRPDYAQAWNNLGVTLARQGRHAEARTKFEAAVALRQDYGRAWLNLAAACLVTGDMAAWAEAMTRARDLGL